LVDGNSFAVRVPKGLFDGHRFATAQVADAPAPEPLRLPGTIILDPNRSSRVHSLFAGQVVRVGRTDDRSATSERLSNTPEDGLRPGDAVKRGQILAVIWSKDVGALKTDLVNQMSKLRADSAVLDRYQSLEPGIIEGNKMTMARQQYEADLVAVRNAERNLRSARFNEDEIAVVVREAEKLKEPSAPRDLELERTWPEIAVRAPFDGLIVEKNVTVGDVVDPTVDLFKVAKLDRLQVLANVYEEDLPKLWQLARRAEEAAAGQSPGEAAVRGDPDRFRAWSIEFAAPGFGDRGDREDGRFEKIGPVIDASQHTGTVSGWVDNRHRRLYVGQYVTATVALPPDPNLVSVPAAAVIEDVDGPAIFVAVDANGREFVRRRVAVAIRGRETIFLRVRPFRVEAARGAEPVAAGEFVIARGAVELNCEWKALRANAR
jgi:cobalt-zinc-cadmium efflux system membrane fusion protein